MSEWNFLDAASRDNVMRVWREEADGFLALAEQPDAWERPTSSGHWEVRDLAGHMVDVTESYFKAFDAARGQGEPWEPLGVRDMGAYADRGALAFRGTDQKVLLDRLREDLERMCGIAEGLSDEEWSGGLTPVHKYMGPLPACFYPVFQVVDYGVHSWDIRCGAAGGHALDGDAADLLVPVSLIVWQSTGGLGEGAQPLDLGVRVTSGHNAGDFRINATADAVTWEPGSVDDLGTVMEFDAGSFVLTAFGRFNGGTVRGDRSVAQRFLSCFFRI